MNGSAMQADQSFYPNAAKLLAVRLVGTVFETIGITNCVSRKPVAFGLNDQSVYRQPNLLTTHVY